MMEEDKDKKEMDLLELVRKARFERTGDPMLPSEGGILNNFHKSMEGGSFSDFYITKDYKLIRDASIKFKKMREERLERQKFREERRKERERERRLKAMDSGFASDDAYNMICDKSLFTGQSTMSTLHRRKRDADGEMYGHRAFEQLDKLMKIEWFKLDGAFAGTNGRSWPRDRPVEFEKNAPAKEDPFCLDQFPTEVKTGKKVINKVGSSGTMKASAGSMRDDNDGSGDDDGSGEDRVGPDDGSGGGIG